MLNHYMTHLLGRKPRMHRVPRTAVESEVEAPMPVASHRRTRMSRMRIGRIPSRSRDLVVAWLVPAGRCASVPPVAVAASAAAGQRRRSRQTDDEYDGWLFKTLTGRQTQAPAAGRRRGVAAARRADRSPRRSGSVPLPGRIGRWPGRAAAAGRIAAAAGPARARVPRRLPPKSEEETKNGLRLADLAPENIYKNVKNGRGLRARREARPDGLQARARPCSARRSTPRRRPSSRRPPTAGPTRAGGRRAVPAGRELLLRRPVLARPTTPSTSLLKKYDNTRYLDTVVAREFAIGRYWEQMHDARAALADHAQPDRQDAGRCSTPSATPIKAYDSVRLNDPDRAAGRRRLDGHGQRLLRQAGATRTPPTTTICSARSIPRASTRSQAHLLGLQSKQMIYQGPIYDGSRWRRPTRSPSQTLTQFGAQAGRRTRTACVEAANRDRRATGRARLGMGQYYEKKRLLRRRPLSTTRRVIKDYPQTPDRPQHGQEAARGDQGLPDEPPEPLQVAHRAASNPGEVKIDGAMTSELRRARSSGARATRTSDVPWLCHLRSPLPLRLCLLPSACCRSPLAGCAGYQIGNQSLYPTDIQTVYVPMFESNSFRRNLGERLTEAVIKEIELKTPYKVVATPDADSVLTGRSSSETKRVVAENRYDDPRQIEVSMQVQVSWIDRQGNGDPRRTAPFRCRRRPCRSPARPTVIARGRPVGRHGPAGGDQPRRRADRGHDGSAVVERWTDDEASCALIRQRLAVAAASHPAEVQPCPSSVETANADAAVRAAAAGDGHRQRHARQLLRRRRVPRSGGRDRPRPAAGRRRGRHPRRRRREHAARYRAGRRPTRNFAA